METLLFVNACLRGEDSRTLRLCRAYLEEYRARHPKARVEHADLAALRPLPLQAEDLARRDALVARGELDAPELALAVRFARADRILVGAPYWDLLFPAALRAYLERICVCGVTFHYTERGAEGLCRAEGLTYLTTAGGFLGTSNFGFDYLRGLCGLLGIPRADFACAEGLDIVGADVEALLSGAEDRVRALLRGPAR